MYDFKWKSDDNARAYGVMAHELQEIFPQAVSGDNDEKNENKMTVGKKNENFRGWRIIGYEHGQRWNKKRF